MMAAKFYSVYVLLLTLILKVCSGQEVTCFIGNLCTENPPLSLNSPEECCQQQPDILTSYKFLSGENCIPCLVIGFAEQNVELEEREESYTFTIGVLTHNGSITDEVVVSYSINPIPPTSTEDFTVSTLEGIVNGGLFVFNQSTLSYDVNITVSPDGIAGEGREQFNILLSHVSGPDVIEFRNLYVNITDNDVLVLSLSANTQTGEGNTLQACVTITKPDVFNELVVVDLIIKGIEAIHQRASEGGDVVHSIVFQERAIVSFSPGGSAMVCQMYDIIDDTLAEPNETFQLSIELNSVTSQLIPITEYSPQELVVTIIDNDNVTIGFLSVTEFPIPEDDKAEVTFGVLAGNLGGNVLVELSFIPDTAIGGGIDYQEVTQLFTLNSAMSEITVPISIINDDIVELTESFNVSLVITDDNGINVILIQNEAVVYILDNDRANFSFKPIDSVNEDSPFVEICVFVQEGDIIRHMITLLLDTMDGTAMEFNDYIPLISEELIFSSGDIERCVNITLLGDDSFEGQEYFIVSGSSQQDVIFTGNVTVILDDNDGVVIGISDPFPSNLSEADVFVTVRVEVISGKLETEVLLNVSTIDVTAEDGFDYIGLRNFSVVLSGQQISQDIEIELIEDVMVEGREIFTVQVMSVDETLPISFNPQTRDIIINDNDRATIGFLITSTSIGEEAPNIEVCFTVKQGDISKDIIVNISSSGQAVAGIDYTDPTRGYIINTDNQNYCVDFDPVDDDLLEYNEIVSLFLTTDDPLVDIDIDQVDILIIDNDIAAFRFIEKQFSENMEIDSVCVEMSPPADGIARSLTLNLTISDISDAGVYDIEFGSTSLTFEPNSGETVCVTVMINDDSFVEGSEDLVLLLFSDDEAVVINTPLQVFIIEDNDVAIFEFEQEEYFVNETEILLVCVVLTNDVVIANQIILTVSSTDGSATDVGDYNTIRSTLSFQSNSKISCINVTTLLDGVLEDTEYFTLQMNSTNPNTDTNDVTQIFIIDSDVLTIKLTEFVYEVNEGDGSATICIMKDKTNFFSFQVSIDIMNMSANFPDDYGLESLSITVPAGSLLTEICAFLPLVDDTEVENDQDLKAIIIIPILISWIQVDEPSSAIIIIHDNDGNITFSHFCSITKDLILETFHTSQTSGITYDFSEGCEHYLINSCDPMIDINVRVDFLHNDFSSGRLAVYYSGENIIINEDLSLNLPTNLDPDISIISNNNGIIIRLSSIELTIEHNRSAINIYSEAANFSSLPVNGLCGSLDGELIFPNCEQTANISDLYSIDAFIDSYKLEPTKQILRPQREECGLTDNSTIIGDPLLTVPLLPRVSDLAQDTPISLCYEIHGKENKYFNFISDECTSVNARYIQPSVADYLNVVDLIWIKTIDNNNECHEIEVNVNGCTVSYDGIQILRYQNTSDLTYTSPFSLNGIEIRVYSHRVRLTVPNCDDICLSMWIVCQSPLVQDPYTDEPLGIAPMLKLVVTGGLNINEYSHGLIGQFWNIPVNITKYTGELLSGNDTSDYYIVSIDHQKSPMRRFVGIVYSITWSHGETMCVYAGNQQGGPINEVSYPNDPVIEGTYEDYIVQDRSDTDFKYSIFREERCDH